MAWSALDRDWPLALAVLAAVLTAVAVSLAYGRLLAPRLAEREPTVRSIGTLGLALVVLGFTEWFWGEQPRRLLFPSDAQAIEFADVRLTYTRVLGRLRRGCSSATPSRLRERSAPKCSNTQSFDCLPLCGG